MPTRPPPDVPSTIEQPVADYLRRLSLWAFQEIDKKIPKDEATPGLVLVAYDVNVNPKVFKVQVTNAGALQANAVPYGGGKP
jgi:hypothetical protein